MLGFSALGDAPLGALPVASASYTLAIDLGAFTVSGVPAQLAATRRIVASTGTFIATGNDAAVRPARQFAAAAGAFAISAQAAAFRAVRWLYASPLSSRADVHVGFAALGQIALGQGSDVADVTVSVAFQAERLASTRRLYANAGAFVLGGRAAELIRFLGVTGAPSSFTWTGNTARLAWVRFLIAGTGTFAETGTVIDMTRRRNGLRVRPSGGQKMFVSTGGAAKGLRIKA